VVGRRIASGRWGMILSRGRDRNSGPRTSAFDAVRTLELDGHSVRNPPHKDVEQTYDRRGLAQRMFKPSDQEVAGHFEKRLQEERKRVLKELGNYSEAFGATPQRRRRRSQLLTLFIWPTKD